jgi:hypothetical protein
MANINKIIRVLDLSQSDAREDTLDGIVKYILYCKEDNTIEQKLISKEIEKEFTIVVHEQDVIDSIERLLDNNLIEKTADNKLKLSSDENLRIKEQSLQINEGRNARLKVFEKNVENIALEKNYSIVEDEISELWEIFKTFIYDCYLTHGKNAIDSWTNGEIEYDESVKKLVSKYLKKAQNKKLGEILEKYIRIYPEVIDSTILKYLQGLANKTEAFYSLGLSHDEYKSIYDDLKFDWVIFVDTNFIYSILDLTTNPEKQSAKFLLELGSEMGIKFKYTTKTFQELNTRKKDFERYLDKDLLPTQIKALLKSKKLDSFAENYYQKRLDDRENTAHPSETIMHSQNIMKEKNLLLYNSKFSELLKNHDHLLDQESAYNTYTDFLDDVRHEKGFMRKGPKDPLQVEHDIFLREAILFLRGNEATSMSNAKFFGTTLDKILIKFDLNQLKRNNTGTIIPVFFKPSILLKKLLKQAPLKTKENYLRAFISTISTPAIDENNHVSKVAIRSLKYFHSMGVDNEKLILDCLRDELFLKGFEKKEIDEKEIKVFIESEINKQITIKGKEIKELGIIIEEKNKEVQKKNKDLDKAEEDNALKDDENENLIKKTASLNDTLQLYSRELKRLKEQSLKTESKVSAIQLSIYDEKESIATEKIIDDGKKKNEDLTERIIQSKLKTRKIKGVILALLSAFLIFLISLIYFFINENWNLVSKLIDNINGLDKARENIAYVLVAIVIGIIDYYVIKKTYEILFDKNAKQDFIKELKKELDKLSN